MRLYPPVLSCNSDTVDKIKHRSKDMADNLGRIAPHTNPAGGWRAE